MTVSWSMTLFYKAIFEISSVFCLSLEKMDLVVFVFQILLKNPEKTKMKKIFLIQKDRPKNWAVTIRKIQKS